MYAHLVGESPAPIWLETTWAVTRYGTQAVFGRALTVQEIRTISFVDMIERAYQSRASAKDFSAWKRNNEELWELLSMARQEAKELGYDIE